MPRPTCKKCKSPLSGEIRYDHTTCLHCGKRWLLTADHTAIYSTTLDVQSTEHIIASPKIGDQTHG